MLKMTIDGEEVVSKNNFTIKEEMLSPSSTILNNTYPKTWEDDKDYTSRFYYPKDYAKLDIQNFSITPEEAGTTIDIVGSTTLTDVDTTKNSRVLSLKGQTSQTGTPTPSSPIPINVVSGDNEINICGKNLFNKDNSQIGKAWNNASASNRAIVITKVEPNTTYYISYQDKSGVDGIYFFGRTNEDDSTTSMGTTGITSSPRQVITLANTNYLGIQFNKDNVSQSDIDKVGIQIEKGTSTTYEPYTGNTYPIYLGDIELCKIGTYQDYIYKDNGSWYLHKEIGKVVLDGTKTVSVILNVDNSNLFRFWAEDLGIDYVNNTLIYSNNYKGKTNQVGRTNFDIYARNDSTRAIDILDNRYSTATDFNTWLSTNNTIVYYVLNTPTTTEITDTTLLEQLDALESQ